MTAKIQPPNRLRAVASDIMILVGLVIALTRSDELPLPPFVNESYPIIFVGIVLVFFTSGYLLLLHDSKRLKEIHDNLKDVTKWKLTIPIMILGTVHIAVMIGLLVFHPSFEQATPEGGLLSMFSFWMIVIVTIVSCILPAIVLESIEYAKDHMKWVERVHSKFPSLYALAYATMSVLMPVFAWGTLAWVIKRTNITTKKLSEGVRLILSASLETSFGFLLAIVIAFETFFVRTTEGTTTIGELLWPTILVFFLLYIPFKWFVATVDSSHDKKHDTPQAVVMIVLQIVIVLLLA